LLKSKVDILLDERDAADYTKYLKKRPVKIQVLE